MELVPLENIDVIPVAEESVAETREHFAQLYALLNKYVKSYADTNEYIYHYTNIDALIGGLIPENTTDDLCFRATNVKHMNDPEELRVDYGRIIETIKKNEFLKLLYEEAEQNQYQFEDYFVVSFSENKDDLPMWSMYGRDGRGIALAFKKDELLTPYPPIKCIYEDSEVFKEIIQLTEKIFASDSLSYIRTKFFIDLDQITHPERTQKERFEVFRSAKQNKQEQEAHCNCDCDCARWFHEFLATTLLAVMPILAYKHNAYQFEKELRLLFHETDPQKIKYRTRNDIIVPYVETKINRSALKYIVVGPTTDINEAKRSLAQFLKAKGFGEIEIVPSSVPYRRFQ